MNIRRYEVTDKQWEKIKELLSAKKTGNPFKNLRHIFNGILWVMCTGTSRRDIPERYGKWNSIYKCFAHWANLGIFEKILAKLSADSNFSELLIDSTYVKVHKAAAGRTFNAIVFYFCNQKFYRNLISGVLHFQKLFGL